MTQAGPNLTLCDDHWNQLRAALTERGLAEHFAKSSEELQALLDANNCGDPVSAAAIAIMNNAILNYGPVAFTKPETSCPMCFHEDRAMACQDHDHAKRIDWITCAADEQAQHWMPKAKA